MGVSSIYKLIVSIGFCSLMFSCSQAGKDRFPHPEIKTGIARVSGKVIHYSREVGAENPVITLSVGCPVTAETIHLETQLDDDGNFYFEEIPIECNTIGFISSDFFHWTAVGVGLVSDEETQIEMGYDENNHFKVWHTIDKLLSTSDNAVYSYEFVDKFLHGSYEKCYDMKPDEYRRYAMDRMKKRIGSVVDSSSLPTKAKNLISNEFQLIYLNGALLNYNDYISRNYYSFKTEEEPDDFTSPEPEKFYYSFLKDFDLNNPQYLYSQAYYSIVLETILRNDTLNIPPVGDTPLDQWMKEVKATMAALVGFDKGLFYDMLAANSYVLPLNNELKPLSDKQKKNIKNYFKGRKEEIAKILLRKNDEVVQLAAEKERLIVNETPHVSKEKLLDAIVSKYQGKVIIMDFWATWCGPCLEAMKEYRTVKSELKGKEVVFVYITNDTSPPKLWEEKIKGISGEHYYLTIEEWKSVSNSDKYGFDAIPTYLIFDKNGKLQMKKTAYPGNEEMREIIEELLSQM
jgi:thiol-disulfide isomerase/thioredoxin